MSKLLSFGYMDEEEKKAPSNDDDASSTSLSYHHHIIIIIIISLSLSRVAKFREYSKLETFNGN